LPTRFLIIGCGSIGKRHLGNLKQLGVQDIIAFDIRPERRQEVQQRFGVPVFAELSAALDQNPGAAVVCTPTSLHLPHALAAAQANYHLFIEKPIADSLEGIEELLAEVRRRRLVTFVQCNFRFHPGLRLVKSLLEEEKIGRVVSARAQFGQYLPDWHPWEDYRQSYSARKDLGGGVILDRIHEIDYLRWLLGEVTEVFAVMGHLSHLEVDTEDVAEIFLRFATGTLGSIHLDYVRRTYDCSLEIIGDEGIIRWRYQDHLLSWYLAKESQWYSRQWPRYEGNMMYLEAMRNFLRALQGEEASAQDAAEGVRVLAIALAAKQAALEGKMLIV